MASLLQHLRTHLVSYLGQRLGQHLVTGLAGVLVCGSVFGWGNNTVFGSDNPDSPTAISEVSPSLNQVIPFILSSPQTGMAVGGVGLFRRTFASNIGKKPSLFVPLGIITSKQQVITRGIADLYFGQDQYHGMISGGFQYFPEDYYGIGNDTRLENRQTIITSVTELQTYFQTNVYGRYNIGPNVAYKQVSVLDFEKGEGEGDEFHAGVPGFDGGKVLGIGVVADQDTRDSVVYPTKGGRYRLSTAHYRNTFGSDAEFDAYQIELRQYKPITDQTVLAGQFKLTSKEGDVPFFELPSMGGFGALRGTKGGRFRDRQAILAQLELRRVNLFKVGSTPIGMVAFVGAGQVSDHINLSLTRFYVDSGFGFRFPLTKDKLNVRLDFAWLADEFSVFLAGSEAF